MDAGGCVKREVVACSICNRVDRTRKRGRLAAEVGSVVAEAFVERATDAKAVAAELVSSL